MSDLDYAPEMQDPGDGDMFGALADVVCEHAGHEWVYAGGGLDICAVCQSQRDQLPGRCSSCGRFLRTTSTYVNRCIDCWTPEDDF